MNSALRKLGSTVILSFAITFISSAQDTIRMVDYGLLPGSRENAIPFVNRAIAEASKLQNPVILFEKGRYDFWPQHSIEKEINESNTTYTPLRRCAFVLNDMQNVTVDCGGADFIFHDKFQPFTVERCSGITIKNVSVDWEIPFGAEAEIVEVTPDYFDLQIEHCKYPFAVEDRKLFFIGEGWKNAWGEVKWNDPMEFDRETLEVTAGTDDDLLGYGWEKSYSAERLGDDLVRIYYNKTGLLKKGNYLVLRHGVRDHAGVFISETRDIHLENINMHSNSGMSFLAQYSEDIYYKNVNCTPSTGRKIISGHDDGLHFSNCKGKIIVEGSVLKGLMDDGLNVHGSYIIITKALDEQTLLCRFPHFQSSGLNWAREGDSIAVVNNKTQAVTGRARVESSSVRGDGMFEIRFEEPIRGEIIEGYALENMTWQPDVTVKGCYFGHHRARGLLVSTRGKVVIENNIFETSGSAIVVPGDLNSYYESAPVTDLTITGNLFKRSCLTSYYMYPDAIVVITTDTPQGASKEQMVHRNISITDNSFEVFDYPVLYAKTAESIDFSGNRINFEAAFPQRHPNKFNLTFDSCRKVTVRKNEFSSNVPGRNIRLVGTSGKELVADKKQGLNIVVEK